MEPLTRTRNPIRRQNGCVVPCDPGHETPKTHSHEHNGPENRAYISDTPIQGLNSLFFTVEKMPALNVNLSTGAITAIFIVLAVVTTASVGAIIWYYRIHKPRQEAKRKIKKFGPYSGVHKPYSYQHYEHTSYDRAVTPEPQTTLQVPFVDRGLTRTPPDKGSAYARVEVCSCNFLTYFFPVPR